MTPFSRKRRAIDRICSGYISALTVIMVFTVAALLSTSAQARAGNAIGLDLSIPKPPHLNPAPAQLANAFQKMAVIPGERQIALFLGNHKTPAGHAVLNMLQVVTSMNGKTPPVGVNYFAKRVAMLKHRKGFSSSKGGSRECNTFLDKPTEFGTSCVNTGKPHSNRSASAASVLLLVKGVIIAVRATRVPASKPSSIGILEKQAMREAEAIEEANR